MSTILSCAIFAAISASSVAVAAMIGTVAGPEMTRRGYDQRFVMGTLAAGATLGILIPPSIPLIVYAAVTEQSTASMFLAGVGPGVLLVGAFLVSCVIKPFMGGAPVHDDADSPPGSRLKVSLGALPTVAIALTMIGGIYAGAFTPTKSAAVGLAMTVIYVMVFRRTLGWSGLRDAVVQSDTTTANLLLIVGGANVFEKAILLYRIPFDISAWIALKIHSAALFILVVMLLLIILGLFLEGIAMILIVLPVLLPSLGVNGIDPIWFGIFFVLMIELALISPPVGMNLFVIQSVARSELREVIIGVIPYALIMLASVAVIYAFPGIILWLPFAG